MIRIIPLAILAAIQLISIGISMEKHGKSRTGTENAWTTLAALIITWGLILWAIL